MIEDTWVQALENSLTDGRVSKGLTVDAMEGGWHRDDEMR